MKIPRLTVLLLFVAGVVTILGLAAKGEVSSSPANEVQSTSRAQGFLGSPSCRECHERFYLLWSASNHGMAMQPYTPEFAGKKLTPQTEVIKIGAASYLTEIGPEQGWVKEISPDEQKTYPIAHVLGGKNVYYFLTPLERGRLQTLPIAYDVNKNRWFDTAASGVRHFPGAGADEPVHWTDPLYTFNTSCYNCHVSQLSSNYDLKTDTYNTQWAEPGINCETCHGPAEKHVKMYQRAKETGTEPDELGLISARTFSAGQMNSMCNSCHAKMSPISASFTPGDRYFDHFDLMTLENPDFYPDGRDLGENYTMTSWRMSTCVKSGKLDCIHCHTSSGRYRFKEPAKANEACLPCHQEQVANIAVHSHHEQKDQAPQCISCHMPMTQFAFMNRTDHSMRPPTPAATLKYKSPNACNLCHAGKDAAWAQTQVADWGKDTRQKQYLRLADYVDQARRGNWQHLDQVLDYIQQPDRDEIVTGSLIRLLRTCVSDKKWLVLVKVLENDPSPFVRSAAARALDGYLTENSLEALLNATKDDYRLVRVRAAAALAAIPVERLNDEYQTQVQLATAELMESLNALPDDYPSRFNLGNIHMQRRDYDKAVASYQTAIKLRPDFVPPYVNIAFVFNAIGDNDKAEASLREAITLDPDNPVIHLNFGMLMAELKRSREAEQAFRSALKTDPNMDAAAYNLGVLLAEDRIDEALTWCRTAYKLRPDEPKYAYTYAFYLNQSGKTKDAVETLQDIIDRQIPAADVYFMLGQIYEQQERPEDALRIYSQAATNENLSEYQRRTFSSKIRQIQGK